MTSSPMILATTDNTTTNRTDYWMRIYTVYICLHVAMLLGGPQTNSWGVMKRNCICCSTVYCCISFFVLVQGLGGRSRGIIFQFTFTVQRPLGYWGIHSLGFVSFINIFHITYDTLNITLYLYFTYHISCHVIIRCCEVTRLHVLFKFAGRCQVSNYFKSALIVLVAVIVKSSIYY